MIIRGAQGKDAASIARVDVDTWRTTYPGIVPQESINSRSYEQRTNVWQACLSESASTRPKWFTPEWFIYVAEDEVAGVVGFAGGGPSNDYGLSFSGELGFIYIFKAYQRQSTGHQLAATVALRLKKQGHNSMVVWVFSANPYRAFYEAMGGKPVAERFVDRYGGHLAEIAYGWQDLSGFEKILNPHRHK
jgi:GNAT superfamily N-acetyltransferase